MVALILGCLSVVLSVRGALHTTFLQSALDAASGAPASTFPFLSPSVDESAPERPKNHMRRLLTKRLCGKVAGHTDAIIHRFSLKHRPPLDLASSSLPYLLSPYSHLHTTSYTSHYVHNIDANHRIIRYQASHPSGWCALPLKL